jgi:hypothetical protein
MSAKLFLHDFPCIVGFNYGNLVVNSVGKPFRQRAGFPMQCIKFGSTLNSEPGLALAVTSPQSPGYPTGCTEACLPTALPSSQ